MRRLPSLIVAGDRPQQAAQRAHGGGLARAVGAEQRHQLALAHLEGDALQHRHGAVAGARAPPRRAASGGAGRQRRGARAHLHLAAAEVGLLDLGVAADGLGRAGGDGPAGIEHHHVVGDAHHQRHVVLDQDHGEAGVGQPAQHARPAPALSARIRPAAGSSSSSTSGRVATARAISTRRRSTWGRSCAGVSSAPV